MMQTTIYYSDNDAYLLDKLDQMARRERISRSAAILSVLELHLEHGKRLGEILLDLEAITLESLSRALQLQQTTHVGKRLGEILLEERLASQEAVDRALLIQRRGRSRH